MTITIIIGVLTNQSFKSVQNILSIANKSNQDIIKCNNILSSQAVSLPLQSVIQEVANFCAAIDTLIDQDGRTISIQQCKLISKILTMSAKNLTMSTNNHRLTCKLNIVCYIMHI